MEVVPGSAAERVLEVTDADTAEALGSGALPVLATPRLLAWCEGAACDAIEDLLGVGETSVGVRVELDHLAATAVGDWVTVRAEVTAVEGRRVVFAVEVSGAGGVRAARGTVERVVVDEARFRGGLHPEPPS
jgi:fluoroacetyl-CoA thioesterase